MSSSTKGVVLHSFKYSETSVIVKVLTREFGTCSYLWKGAKGKKNRGRSGSILQPLNRVEITAGHKPHRDLHVLKEIAVNIPFKRVLFEVERSSLALFLGEFLYRISQVQEKDPEYFDAVYRMIETLDTSEEIADLHLHFLTRFTLVNGIIPEVPEEIEPEYFDILNAEFTNVRPSHEDLMEGEHTKPFLEMLRSDFQGGKRFTPNRGVRNTLLREILDFYRIHLGDFGPIHALDMFREVFDAEENGAS